MNPSVSPTVRQTWARLEGRDFDAVDDLIASLEDVDASGFWGHVDVVGEFQAEPSPVKVIRSVTALLAMVEVDRLEIFALGRPGL